MASFVYENYESVNSYDGFDSGALLMSQLLEESHVEDCDNERLTTVIRSLEAEIEPVMLIEDNESIMELEWDDNLAEFCDNNWNGEHTDVGNAQDCSTTSSDDELDNYNWMEIEDLNEFGGFGDYYYHYPQFINQDNDNVYSNILEEQSCGSLWQDTDVLIM